MILHRKIKIFGKVQGVFFRASAKKKAGELSIMGLVKNEKDGSVYIEAEGEEIQMQKFLSWCKSGPPGSTVTKVEVTDGLIKNFKGFEIKH